MIIVVWNSYINDTNPIILDEKQEEEIPWVQWCRNMNALCGSQSLYEYLKCIVTVKPKTLRIKRHQVDLFVRSRPSRPFRRVLKLSLPGTWSCEISQTEAHQTASLSRALLLSCCFIFVLWPHTYWWSCWFSRGRDCDIDVLLLGTAEYWMPKVSSDNCAWHS